MKRSFILAGLLALGVSVPARANGFRTMKFQVGATCKTVELARRGFDVQLSSVRVNGDTLVFGDQVSSNVAMMYGHGVALRFMQHGKRFTVRAVSVNSRRARIAVRFWLITD